MFDNLPAPLKMGLMVISAGGLLGVVYLFVKDPTLLMWIGGGIAIIMILLFLYRLILAWRDKAKGSPFAKLIAGSASGGAGAAMDPAKKARMDDLRKKFEEGVTTFRAAGKDLYALPWYLLVGPSGSGKTEMLRHSNIGFPPGLQDCLQGAGGTVNMHWWFTNHAVVLDTAGRMFMEEVDQSQNSEWKEFLKMMRQARGNCPVNGMLLVIGIDSLIKDSAEQIEQKAGKIARQLDGIQRILDVRFPVYVVVTKCDLIPGFREFFDNIDDPQLQHQILGWSNPNNLDNTFNPDEVDKYLASVRDRLQKRRLSHLLDPVHTEDPQAR
ncbi:MAG: type VI secretion protein IcmF/TssM N-terminal domain-containing protein, partial [Planctomycetota bacterium]|nr:type VI secretion protein IcmF/TssM N-terminal domain-containing protein [Planctomycetota bacterium]